MRRPYHLPHGHFSAPGDPVHIVKREAPDFAPMIAARSRNLRGVLDYARRHPVTCATVYTIEGGALVYFRFEDGAECRVQFSDPRVARWFIDARRSWREAGLEQGAQGPSQYHWRNPPW